MAIDKHLTVGEHTFKTATGATLSYYVRGKGTHVLVLVAPGWGCASVLYQNSFTFLEDTFTFVHLEVRGTRKSSFPDDASLMSSWHMSEDVEALRIYLGVDALDGLAGHSNGGCIAMWYAIRYPTRVRKLVLLDSQLLGPEADAVREPATKAILDASPERDAVDAFLNGPGPQGIPSDAAFAKAIDDCLALYFARPERDLDRFKKRYLTNVPQIRCWKLQDLVEGKFYDQDSQLGSITARTLVIVGRQDFICPLEVSVMLAAGISDCKLEIIEDSGHFTWVEQQARFAGALKPFFQAL